MDEQAIAATAAWATLAANAIAASAGGLSWWLVRTSAVVWPLLRAGQLVAVAQAAAAGVLLVVGYEPSGGLYWLYAVLPVAIGIVAEQLRIASAEQVLETRGLADAEAVGALPEREQRSVVRAIVRREIGVVAIAAGVVALLALRAALVA